MPASSASIPPCYSQISPCLSYASLWYPPGAVRLKDLTKTDTTDLMRVRIVFTVWMAVWTPVILWAYGPQNFLWLCNVAQFLVLYALWAGDRFILSSQAGTVCLIGLVWVLDFIPAIITGGATAMITAYMFNPEYPMPTRIASMYHVFLPALILWVLYRRGYDRRGPWLQCAIGGLAIIGTWLLTDPERNVNWVAAPFHTEQVWMPDVVWVVVMLVLGPLLIYWPGHGLVLWALGRFRRTSATRNGRMV